MATRRTWLVAVVVLGATCAGCGTNRQVAATDPQPRTAENPSLEPATSAAPVPYVDAPQQIAQLSDQFVRAALCYDSTSDSPTAFIRILRPVTAPAELGRLRHSARARLDWRALRTRHERTSIQVTGTSVASSPSVVPTTLSPVVVVVEAERITVTTFGTVRDFVEVTVDLDRDRGQWRVSSATGGGL
ncbi:MAG: hypothetical protein JWR52_1165 [Marmoricola sp.]|nr:hypothetical protein [Marmoricola sp.]